MYDYIVIGAGYGGISAAALLSKSGFKVLLLESHSVAGGCASYFKRKDFLFDVGATTLSGVLPHQPLGILFDQLKINPRLKKIDPGVIVKMGDQTVNRYSDPGKWIQEAEIAFGGGNQRNFWEAVFDIDKRAWNLLEKNFRIPPKSVSDYLSALRIENFNGIRLLPSLFRSTLAAVEKFKLSNNMKFMKFLSEQLLITTQNSVENAPFLTAAMGLAYPSQTYYPFGGIYYPAQLMLEKFRFHNGEVKYKERVERILKVNGRYDIYTAKGRKFSSMGIISNIPIWNMSMVTEGKMSEYFGSLGRLFNSAWGAFVINFAIETKASLDSVYFQIHSREKIPFCPSDSVFISFSAAEDRERAPEGWRTVTISAHTRVEFWENLSKDQYEIRKRTVTEAVLKIFDDSFPEMKESTKMFILSGSPGTFEFYTKRYKGYVGGIPHSVNKSIFKMPPNVTPFENLFMVGDTVFPGQGTPAVVLGALNVYRRIISKL